MSGWAAEPLADVIGVAGTLTAAVGRSTLCRVMARTSRTAKATIIYYLGTDIGENGAAVLPPVGGDGAVRVELLRAR